MSYQDKTKDYGDPFLNDPGDEPAYTEDDEFEILRDGGITPEQVADPAAAERYAEWLKKNPPENAEQPL
jgi:hypothetical protein